MNRLVCGGVFMRDDDLCVNCRHVRSAHKKKMHGSNWYGCNANCGLCNCKRFRNA